MLRSIGIQTEEDFIKYVLPETLRNDPDVIALADKNVFKIIFAFNDFEDPDEGLHTACHNGQLGFAELMIKKRC